MGSFSDAYSDTDKAPLEPAAARRGGHNLRGPNLQRILNFTVAVSAGFHSSDRRWYFGSMSLRLGVTSLIIIRDPTTSFLHYCLHTNKKLIIKKKNLSMLQLFDCHFCDQHTLFCHNQLISCTFLKMWKYVALCSLIVKYKM